MKITKPKEKMRVRVKQDHYFKYKDKKDSNEFFEYVPVDWQGKIVPQKGRDNMQDVAREIGNRF
jgi:hypothetical protein